jgi:hypothetical protein
VDTSDPDYIAAHPPEKVADPKTYFQEGKHADQWCEYDDRGVPTKNAKKKKPTKKERDALEAEFLDAKREHQQYVKDVEEWEQAKVDAESALEKTDQLRWAFRRVGNKIDRNLPISPDELTEFFEHMGWNNLGGKQISAMKKAGTKVAEKGDGMISLEVLREFVSDTVPIVLIEERLKSGLMEEFLVEEVYSPRTWRGKLDNDPPPLSARGKNGTGSKSPRGGATSPRGRASDARKSTSGKMKKETSSKGPASPRGGKGDGSQSARGKKKS